MAEPTPTPLPPPRDPGKPETISAVQKHLNIGWELLFIACILGFLFGCGVVVYKLIEVIF